jgi:serine/threonine-protein kinase
VPDLPCALPSPGQVIAGRYRIERLLARGGHGTVFVAEQLATEAKVALKVLQAQVLESLEARERFELEAKIAGRVASDFIVRVLDAGVDDASGLPFIAMELLEGESLADVVAQRGPLSMVETATCLLQIGQGLDKAHAHRSKDGKPTPIIHRDLKPENLFLATREDGERVAKILDFGVAKVISENVAKSRDINGSPLYIAYEQLTSGALSARTDVWALGLVAFFLLAGRPYWRSASAPNLDVAAIFAEVLHAPIVPPSQRATELGVCFNWRPAFDAWFLRCVQRDPEGRFASAGEAAQELLQALLGSDAATGPIARGSLPFEEQAHAVTAPARAQEQLRPRRSLAAWARLAFTGALVTAVAAYAAFHVRADASTGALAPSRSSVPRRTRERVTSGVLPAATVATKTTATAPPPSSSVQRLREPAPPPAGERLREVFNDGTVHRKSKRPRPPSRAPSSSSPSADPLLNSPLYSER